MSQYCDHLDVIFDDAPDYVGFAQAVTSTRILGYFASVEALTEAVPNPNIGDTYGIGEEAPYNLYVYSSNGWIDNGVPSGPPGPPGPPGPEVTAENIETALGFKPLPVSNLNLFHNWWFGRGVVNQRGKTTYSAEVQYTIDRWKTTNANTSVIVNPDSITIKNTTAGSAGYLLQVLEDYTNLLGKPVTMSAMLGDKNIIQSTANMPNVVPATSTTVLSLMDGDKSIGDLLFYPVNDKMQLWGRIGSAPNENSRTFKAAKLERGRVSTIADDQAPDPCEELRKCQRFLFQSATTSNNMFLGDTGAGSKAPRFHVPVPVPMYTGTPLTVSIVAPTTYVVAPTVSKNLGKPTVATAVNNGPEVYVTLSETAEISDTAYQLCGIQTRVSISAEL